MRSIETVLLEGEIKGGRGIEFIEVEFFSDPFSPLGVVHYSLDGQRQRMGLRIDLDKQIFLDHFDDMGRESLASNAALEIVALLSRGPNKARASSAFAN